MKRQVDRVARLRALTERPSRRVVGLMSGTSVDAIDAALVEITGAGAGARVELLAFESFPFPASVRARVFEAFDAERARVDALCQLDFVLGELFAEAVLALLRRHGLSPSDVDLVGAAGQTVWHAPDPTTLDLRDEAAWIERPFTTRATLALGQSAVIAERTGLPVVGDLRVRDVAAGGHGAPLVAYADWVLFADPTCGRAVQNIGGIGNVTWLPPGATLETLVAFDTGPGNMLIDAFAALATGGVQTFDEDGRLAAAGTVDEGLLREWLSDPYFAEPPPKTTGRERFGAQFARRVVADHPGHRPVDLVATATALTARSIAGAYRDHLRPRGPVDEVVVGGGGAANPTLMAWLRRELPGVPVRTHEELGIPSQAKECLAIALIANDALLGLPTNASGATGGRPTVLGKVCP